MFKGEIYRRVMSSVKAKIEERQAEYDNKVVELEEEFENRKEKLLDEAVQDILHRVL